jgi:hypothetical protein
MLAQPAVVDSQVDRPGFWASQKAFDFRRPLSMISRGVRLSLAPVIRAEFFEGRMTDVSSA